MSDTVFKDLTVREQALLDAGAHAAKVKAFDPIVAPEHILGNIEGLALAYGQLVGHARAAEKLAGIALKAHTFAVCDESAAAAALKRRHQATPSLDDIKVESPLFVVSGESANVIPFTGKRRP